MNNVLAFHYSTMVLAHHYTIQFSPIKHNVSACCISALRQFILILGPILEKFGVCTQTRVLCSSGAESGAQCSSARHKTER